jgi:hypothetical protein
MTHGVILEGDTICNFTVVRSHAGYGAEVVVGERLICTPCEFATLGALFDVLAAQVAGVLSERRPAGNGG